MQMEIDVSVFEADVSFGDATGTNEEEEDITSAVPEFLLTELRKNGSVPPSTPPDKNYGKNISKDKAVISSILNDGNLNQVQKEKLSASLLLGDYEIFEQDPQEIKQSNESFVRTQSQSHMLSPHNTKTMAHLQRHGHRPRFLEIESSRAEINAPEQKFKSPTIKGPEKREGYYWAGKFMERLPEVKTVKSTVKAVAAEKQPAIVGAYKKAREDNIRQSAEFVREYRKQAALKKESVQESLLHQLEVHKKLQRFREKLKARLQERGDKQIGMIMRCIDEEMVHGFLETHKGFSMSVDAILAQVGSSNIAARTLRPSSLAEGVFEDEDEEWDEDYLGGMQTYLTASNVETMNPKMAPSFAVKSMKRSKADGRSRRADSPSGPSSAFQLQGASFGGQQGGPIVLPAFQPENSDAFSSLNSLQSSTLSGITGEDQNLQRNNAKSRSTSVPPSLRRLNERRGKQPTSRQGKEILGFP